MTVTEIAQLKCRRGEGDAFAMAVTSAIGVIARSSEARDCRVLRGVEEPETFTLIVEWPDVEGHSTFRASPQFAEYRSFVQHLLAEPPQFGHFSLVAVAPRSALGD